MRISPISSVSDVDSDGNVIVTIIRIKMLFDNRYFTHVNNPTTKKYEFTSIPEFKAFLQINGVYEDLCDGMISEDTFASFDIVIPERLMLEWKSIFEKE